MPQWRWIDPDNFDPHTYPYTVQEVYHGLSPIIVSEVNWHKEFIGPALFHEIKRAIGFIDLMPGQIDPGMYTSWYNSRYVRLDTLIENAADLSNAVWWFEPLVNQRGFKFHFRVRGYQPPPWLSPAEELAR